MAEKKVLNTLSAYGSGFQVKVLSGLLKDREFLQSVHDTLDKDYFDSPAHKWVIDEVLRYYRKYHTNPTLESLQVEVRKIDNEVLKVSVIDQVKEALKALNDDRDYIHQEFSNFCKNQHLKKALLSSVDLLSKGEYEDIRNTINSALKAGQGNAVGHEYDKDIETRYRLEDRAPVATPWELVTSLLQGGLGKGDLGILLGGPGSGKSWFLVNLGVAAIKAGLTVCHYTLELAEGYTALRYDSKLTGYDMKSLGDHRAEVEAAVAKMPGKLIIKEFPMGKASAHTIENHIRKCKDLGFAPDLVIIDYIDLMKAHRSRQDNKEELDDIYTSVKGMARELKIPIWSVSQVNRAGAKDDIIEADKIAGSYNKVMIADFALSISRKRADKITGKARIHILKNRYGADGMTYASKVNTSNGDIEISNTEITEEEISVMEQVTNSRVPSKMTAEDRQLLAKRFSELTGK
jgi:replicative DNA helicase